MLIQVATCVNSLTKLLMKNTMHYHGPANRFYQFFSAKNHGNLRYRPFEREILPGCLGLHNTAGSKLCFHAKRCQETHFCGTAIQ